MAIKFNAGEVLDMAVKIERNGARFYRKAAEGFDDERVKKMLNELAAWEDGHELTFKAIKEDLDSADRESVVFDPNGDAPLYLGAMADGNVFRVDLDPSESLTGNESIEEVLRKAIGLEKDSIVFYLGLREIVPEKLGRDKVDHILKEEMGHITYLNNELKALKE